MHESRLGLKLRPSMIATNESRALGPGPRCLVFPLRGEGESCILHSLCKNPRPSSSSVHDAACRLQSCPRPAFSTEEQIFWQKQEKGSDLALPHLLR